MGNELEEGTKLQLDFTKLRKIQEKVQDDVIPVAVQDYNTKELLIIAYANKAALENTIKSKMATFWSTSRNELWIKGKTSGDYLEVKEIRVNCDQNSLLYLVIPKGKGACHTKDANGNPRVSCYYRKLKPGTTDELEFI